MPCERHLLLLVEGSTNRQATPVEALADGTFRIDCTPGFVEGVAAGDVIRLVDEASGQFEVVRRGGNVGLKVFCTGPIGPLLEWMRPEVERIGGWLDGNVDRAAVFTVPVASGFPAMESLMAKAGAAFDGIEWYFSNVYDADHKPLNWWRDP